MTKYLLRKPISMVYTYRHPKTGKLIELVWSEERGNMQGADFQHTLPNLNGIPEDLRPFLVMGKLR